MMFDREYYVIPSTDTSPFQSIAWKFRCLADRLLVADFDYEKHSHAVIELKVSARRVLGERIGTSENLHVLSWCAVNDKLAIFDYNNKDILDYLFD